MLLVLVRPLTLTPPLADRFCHEVGGSGGRGLGQDFCGAEASLSLVSTCSVLMLWELDNGRMDNFNEEDEDRFVRFRLESRRVNGDGASSSSLRLAVSMHVLPHIALSSYLSLHPRPVVKPIPALS